MQYVKLLQENTPEVEKYRAKIKKEITEIKKNLSEIDRLMSIKSLNEYNADDVFTNVVEIESSIKFVKKYVEEMTEELGE